MKGFGTQRTYGPCWYPDCSETPIWKAVCPGSRPQARAIFFSCDLHIKSLRGRLYRRAPLIEPAKIGLAAER